MPQASAYPVLADAIVTRLKGRPGLATVQVLDHVPINSDDIRTINGKRETIYMGEAEGGSADVIMCAGQMPFDETLVQSIGIEVLGTSSNDTQSATRARANELLYEVLDEISSQKDWDRAALGLDIFEFCDFTPLSYSWGQGRLQQTGVYGAVIDVGLELRARRRFP